MGLLTPELKEKLLLLVLDKGLLALLVLVAAWVLNSLIERLKANMAFVLEVNKGSFGHIATLIQNVRDADLAVLSLIDEAEKAKKRAESVEAYKESVREALAASVQALDQARRELSVQSVWLNPRGYRRVKARLARLGTYVQAGRDGSLNISRFRKGLLSNRPIYVRSLL